MRVLCAVCEREVWYWTGVWRIGNPYRTYCSEECAQYDGDERP